MSAEETEWETKKAMDDYKFKLQKAEQDINTLQTNVSSKYFFRFSNSNFSVPERLKINRILYIILLKTFWQVARLESQVIRFKTAAETAERSEEELKTERRKMQREVIKMSSQSLK